jgi:16S rRNA processing protein RimM
MPATSYVIVGRIGRPHGVRGEVFIEPITDAPAAVFAAGRRVFAGTTDGDVAAEAGVLAVRSARAAPDGRWVVGFDRLADRDEAERWRGRYLLLPASEIEPPGEGEAFLHELPGMRVELPTGEVIGEVEEIFELPQGIVLDVRWRGRIVTLPFNDVFLRELDREGRRIVLDLPEGLLE